MDARRAPALPAQSCSVGRLGGCLAARQTRSLYEKTFGDAIDAVGAPALPAKPCSGAGFGSGARPHSESDESATGSGPGAPRGSQGRECAHHRARPGSFGASHCQACRRHGGAGEGSARGGAGVLRRHCHRDGASRALGAAAVDPRQAGGGSRGSVDADVALRAGVRKARDPGRTGAAHGTGHQRPGALSQCAEHAPGIASVRGAARGERKRHGGGGRDQGRRQ